MNDAWVYGRLTSVTLENFRSIGRAVTIEMKPLTLLFGPNSAGKSTVLQGINYICHLLGGEIPQSGNFREIVHGGDINKRVRIRADFLVEDFDFPSVVTFGDHEGSFDVRDVTDLDSIWVECIVGSVGLSKKDQDMDGPPCACMVHQFGVGIDGVEMIRCRSIFDKVGERAGPGLAIEPNYEHPAFKAIEAEFPAMQLLRTEPDALWGFVFSEPDEFRLAKDENGDLTGCVFSQPYCVPLPGRYPAVLLGSEHADVDVVRDRLAGTMQQILFGARGLAVTALNNIRRVGPFREKPPRGSLAAGSTVGWESGLAAWEMLASMGANMEHDKGEELKDDALIRATGNALEKLRTGFSLYLKRVAQIDISGGTMGVIEAILADVESKQPEYILLAAKEFLDAAPQQREVLLRDTVQDVLIHPSDAAMGIVQLVPVIVALLVDGANVCVVEQPELHLHPRVQCELGSFLADCIETYPQRVMLIETHSEHLLLRLQRLIKTGKLAPSSLSVTYFARSQKGADVSTLRLDRDGEFIDEWPEGFFEESFNEVFGDA